MNNSIFKDFLKLMLSVSMVAFSVNSALAVYNPNGFSLQQEAGLNQLHDVSNMDTKRYENYVRQDYEQRYTEPMPAVEDNRTPEASNANDNNNAMNAGVTQTQTGNSVYIGTVTIDESKSFLRMKSRLLPPKLRAEMLQLPKFNKQLTKLIVYTQQKVL